MATRVATTKDILEIVDFLEKYHTEGSNLSDIPFDRRTMANAVEYYIRFPKHVCFVYQHRDKIQGVLMGSIEPFMFNDKRKWATDLLNVAESGGPWLMKRFMDWAKMHKVDRIIMGVSTENPRTDALYEVMGLKRLGGMYMMNLTSEARQ